MCVTTKCVSSIYDALVKISMKYILSEFLDCSLFLTLICVGCCARMVLKLYYMAISPPARAALLALRNLDLKVEIRNVNLLKGEHMSQEFLILNPLHQVPVLVDDNFVLHESRAIMTYLVNKYMPGSSLYPLNPQQRALIDQRLYYDATVVFERNAAAIVIVY